MQNYTKTITSSSSISVGMDVHKKTIAFCLDHAETGVVLDERELLHDLPKVINYLQKVQTRHGELSCGYEASSCGFRLQRTLQAKGISCEVIAPSSIPRRSGDRVKTDRRDAKKLATMYAAGVLTPIHIPDEAQEALRSLLRCRGDFIGYHTSDEAADSSLSFRSVDLRIPRLVGPRNFIRGFVPCPSRGWIKTRCTRICTNSLNLSKKCSE